MLKTVTKQLVMGLIISLPINSDTVRPFRDISKATRCICKIVKLACYCCCLDASEKFRSECIKTSKQASDC